LYAAGRYTEAESNVSDTGESGDVGDRAAADGAAAAAAACERLAAGGAAAAGGLGQAALPEALAATLRDIVSKLDHIAGVSRATSGGGCKLHGPAVAEAAKR
jgi:hypothetical protein